MKLRKVVVIGASVAGLAAIEGLREFGYDGSLVFVGEEADLPYDRPPLSKDVLQGRKESWDVSFRASGHYESLDVELRMGTKAESIDLGARRVLLNGGEEISFDGLIIATGARPRRLPGMEACGGIYSLRTLEDCLRLRSAFSKGTRLVVIGAGFIGVEVAASARKLGLDVTVVEALPVPFLNVLGETIGNRCAALHQQQGVVVRCGVHVDSFVGRSWVEGVRLSDGSVVAADVVVVGVGVVPNTGWLESSGLVLDNGVVCDEYCATGVSGIYAIGDVANWFNPAFDVRMRVEHWTNAREQGRIAARNLLMEHDEKTAYKAIPYFWSDQYDTKIQCVGCPHLAEESRIVQEDIERVRLVAIYRRRDRIVGAITFNNPVHLARYQNLIANQASWQRAVDYAEGV